MPSLYNGVLLASLEQWTAATWSDTAAAPKTVLSKSHIQKHVYFRASLIQMRKTIQKKYCGIRNQKVVVTGKKEEGDGLEMSLICFPIGVGMLFCCLSDAFNCHRCLSIVSTDHLSTYESLYFMLCITRLKGKDSSDSREVFQKERSPCGSLYTHCGICSPLTQYRAEVSF